CIFSSNGAPHTKAAGCCCSRRSCGCCIRHPLICSGPWKDDCFANHHFFFGCICRGDYGEGFAAFTSCCCCCSSNSSSNSSSNKNSSSAAAATAAEIPETTEAAETAITKTAV